MKNKLNEYIKLGFGFYIGYNFARTIDEILRKLCSEKI